MEERLREVEISRADEARGVGGRDEKYAFIQAIACG